jgi:hypothetical protein
VVFIPAVFGGVGTAARNLEHNYPRSVITDRIAPENVHRLIAQIGFCRGLG